ncbi:hypothetical protein RDI58_022315 [Solanum bulbocastanum]|uniref:Exonuclease domain-containing protein n=1 Tax=Solanum bulbocastanum TaxID=147425 RepID=A0AAN8Y5Z5_SOLBU
MNQLSNAFSLLNLDVADSQAEITNGDTDRVTGEGLDIEVDKILEIACIVTNGNLTKSIEGPDLVIHQAKLCLDNMGAWCQEHHAVSGLTEKVLKSTVTEEEAEKLTGPISSYPTILLKGCEYQS